MTTALGKTAEKIIELAAPAFRVGLSLLHLFGNDEKKAMAAIRALEIELRAARDKRMGKRPSVPP